MTEPSFDDSYIPPEPVEDVPPPPPDDGGGYAPAENFKSKRSKEPRYGDFRHPPADREAEQGVLGAMLLSPNTAAEILEILRDEDFFYPQHSLIFRAMMDLFSNGMELDAVILAGRLDRYNELERVGGAPYLHTLLASVPTAANARYYAEIVAEKAILRRLVDAGTQVVQLGFEATEDAEIEFVLNKAQQAVLDVSRRKQTEDYKRLEELIDPTIDELVNLQNHGGIELGVPTGLHDLDKLTNGLHAGQMVIVAARPGVGKSTLAMDFMRSCSLHNNKTSVIFSLEMSASEILMRLLSAESEVKLADMRAGRINQEDWAKLEKTLDKIQNAPMFIDDSPNLTMMEIRTKARKIKQQHGLDLIVLDYMQLMSSGKKVESRQQEVSEFSRNLKLLAKELEVPLIAISQLNRGPEARTDKKPQLADLRESGSLEQDADMVMLLYRPDSQERDNERAGEADIILAKHRGGPIDTVTIAHQLHYSKFVNMAHG
ncbi:helicase DnaB [Corynebacterium phocae]|uniref:Replicative DNA helicase n=1 Tax=Corynebacterium phocae TaxID=161895 RepID=A0A1L7D5L9_9CORY|nr:replicative DNA helicase [Corynebacterium phocae]APT93466.1 helicase DnaB [Corynebacterium phocae]KAA8721027.1 replicative DNA helicase [Corynebacterium phocae]